MDEVDKQLVQAVEQNARQSSGAIAKHLNVSSATVRRRLKRLIDANELHFVAHADPVKSGFPVSALAGLNIDHDLHGEVRDVVCKLPEVSWALPSLQTMWVTKGRFVAMGMPMP